MSIMTKRGLMSIGLQSKKMTRLYRTNLQPRKRQRKRGGPRKMSSAEIMCAVPVEETTSLIQLYTLILDRSMKELLQKGQFNQQSNREQEVEVGPGKKLKEQTETTRKLR